jgi:hypothetical protein
MADIAFARGGVRYARVPGFPGYYASEDGHVWSQWLPRRRVLGTTVSRLRPGVNSSGYLQVALYRQGVRFYEDRAESPYGEAADPLEAAPLTLHIFQWVSLFRVGDESPQTGPHEGQPCSSMYFLIVSALASPVEQAKYPSDQNVRSFQKNHYKMSSCRSHNRLVVSDLSRRTI